MDPAYREAMEALGRPVEPAAAAAPAAPVPSMPPPSAPERVSFADPLSLVVGLGSGALIGAAIGVGGIALTPEHLALPGVLTLVLCAMLSRPLHQVAVAAVAASVLCTVVGVPLSVMPILGGIW